MSDLEYRGDAPVVRSEFVIDLANHVKGNTVSIVINEKTLIATSLADGSAAMVTAIIAAFAADTAPPEFKELTATDTTDLDISTDSQVTLLGPEDGTPITITSISTTGGGSAVDELQTISIDQTPTGGTYTLSWDPDNQGYVNALATAFGDSSSQIETDIQTIRGVERVANGGFDSDIEWTKGANWQIGSGVANQSSGSASDLTQTAKIALIPGRSYELIYSVTNFVAGTVTPKLGGTAGSTRSSNGSGINETIIAGEDGRITFSASASFDMDIDDVSVQARVAVGDIDVEGGPLGVSADLTFTFSGSGYDDENVLPFKIDADALTYVAATGIATVTQTRAGRGSVNAVQRLTMSNLPDSGNYTLGFDDGSSLETTGSIAAGASPEAIKTALELLSNVTADDIIASNGPLTKDFIDFSFASGLSATNARLLVFTDVSLVYGSGQTAGVALVEHRKIGHGVNDEAQLSSLSTAQGPATWIKQGFRVIDGANKLPVNSDTVSFFNQNTDCLFSIDQNAVVLTTLEFEASYTGSVGLMPTNNRNDSSYSEYRTRPLKIGATNLNIGQGTGSGSGRLILDTGTDQTATKVYSTGSALDSDFGALMLAGSNASSTLEVIRGSVDVAVFPGQTAQYTTVTVRGGRLRTSNGTTLATVAMEGSGILTDDSAITTLTAKDTSSTRTTGAMTTATLEGEASLNCDNTITTLKMSDQSTARVTGAITTCNVDGNSVLNAEAAITTLTTADNAEVTLREGGIVTACTIFGSLLKIENSSAVVLATLDLGTNATLDLSDSKASVTITADLNVASGVTILDPMDRLVASVKPSFIGLQDITWISGKNRQIDIT